MNKTLNLDDLFDDQLTTINFLVIGEQAELLNILESQNNLLSRDGISIHNESVEHSNELGQLIDKQHHNGISYAAIFIDINFFDNDANLLETIDSLLDLDSTCHLFLTTNYQESNFKGLANTPSSKIIYLRKPLIPEEVWQMASIVLHNHQSHEQMEITSMKLVEYQSAIDNHTMLCIVDVTEKTSPFDGMVIYVNQLYCQVNIVEQNQLINHPFHNESLSFEKEDKNEVWQQLKNGHLWHGVINNLNQNDSMIWADCSIVPVRNEQGQLIKYLMVSNEITEMIRLQESLKQSNRQSMKMLQEMDEAWHSIQKANDAKSRFLASMSHELRTPINGMIGMSDLLSETLLTEQQRCYVETVSASGQQLLAVVNDILDFSKIEAGQYSLESIELNLRDMIEDVILTVSHTALLKGLELGYVIDDNVPTKINSDKKAIQQILTNLVGNACKFTAEGFVVIVVKFNDFCDLDDTLYFGVEDSGIGITAEQQKHIFEVFQQADTSTSRKYGGTGLGLNISGELVRLLQGELEVDSEENVGSCFHFEIPVENPVHEASDQLQNLCKKQIAVIEESKYQPSVLVKHLREHHFNIKVFQQTDDILNAPGELKDIDLLIVSSSLDQLTGLEFIEHIKNIPCCRHLIYMYYLNVGEIQDKAKLSRLGIKHRLDRPLRHKPLINTLSKAFGEAIIYQDDQQENNVELEGTLLIVDDNQTNRMVAGAILEKLGLTIKEAPNGNDALTMTEKEKFDVILMDYQMPGLDGAETVEGIRLQEQQTNGVRVPILMLTADVLEDTRDRCVAAGADGFLSKPIRKEQLRNTVAKWLADNQNQSSTDSIENVGQTTDDGLQSDGVTQQPKPVEKIMDDLPEPINEMTLSTLKEILGEEQIENLITVYVSDVDRFKTEMDELVTNDYDGLAKKAHAIKGNYSTPGAEHLAIICKEVELKLKAGEVENVAADIARISNELDRVCEYLKNYQ
jgi:two-component system, sensor histidine kinase and response regulator